MPAARGADPQEGGGGSSLCSPDEAQAGCLPPSTIMWEFDDSVTTRAKQRWLGGAGRPLLQRRHSGGGGSSRAGSSGSLGVLPPATRFASIAASGAAKGQRISADGLQAVPAGVVEGEWRRRTACALLAPVAAAHARLPTSATPGTPTTQGRTSGSMRGTGGNCGRWSQRTGQMARQRCAACAAACAAPRTTCALHSSPTPLRSHPVGGVGAAAPAAWRADLYVQADRPATPAVPAWAWAWRRPRSHC